MGDQAPDSVEHETAVEEAVERWYVETRKQYLANEFEVSRDYDKWSITVAGAALGISITFLSDVVELSDASGTWLLAIGWVAFALAVACLLASLKCGVHAYMQFRRALDAAVGSGFDGGALDRAHGKQASCVSAKVVDFLRWIGLGLILVGLLSLIVFVLVNLGSPLHGGHQSSGKATATAEASGPGATATATSGASTAKASVKP